MRVGFSGFISVVLGGLTTILILDDELILNPAISLRKYKHKMSKAYPSLPELDPIREPTVPNTLIKQTLLFIRTFTNGHLHYRHRSNTMMLAKANHDWNSGDERKVFAEIRGEGSV